MRYAKEEPSSSTVKQAIDLVSAVKELHGLGSQELTKLIRDSENNTLQHFTEKGLSIRIDVEKLARYLPLHLIAQLMSSKRDEALFIYLLCGIQLLHSLCDLAPRNPKLEQILLDDVKVSEQLLDLVFYSLIVLGGYRQEHHISSPVPLLHSALVACSLYLLTGCISSQWPDLAHVLIAHPKVDIFMDAAFSAVLVDINFLQMKLSVQSIKSDSSEETLNHLFQQCEASLQFLQSLCQQKLFRERLVKNKELCGKGGVLLLAQAVLSLNVAPLLRQSSSVVAAVSRMKSKVLSILLHLCEVESISYLDEVANTPQSLDLAKSVALEVLELLKTMFSIKPHQLDASSDKAYPRGLLQLNSLRLTDIFSDDSNFRSYITIYFTEVLTAIFLIPHGEFLSSWCSSDLPMSEEDATLEYDPIAAAGCVVDPHSTSDLLNASNSGSNFTFSNMPRASYAHQRTSLLVKVIANLHCFVPDICKEEKDLFLNKFLKCLQKELPKKSDRFSFASEAYKAIIVSRNLRSLLSHAESLIPTFLNEDDVQLLRVFFTQVESLMAPAELEVNHDQEVQSIGGCSSPLLRKVAPDLTNRISNLKEGMSENSSFQEVDQFYIRSNSIDQFDDIGRQDKIEDEGNFSRGAGRDLREIDRDVQSVETSASDSSTTREKNFTDPMDNVEFAKSSTHIEESGFGGVQDEEKAETVQSEEKFQRKRKRSLMTAEQITLIEKALVDEPDMQRNAALLQSWSDILSDHGPEISTSQLKNWLNNRKARLARAAKDVPTPSEGDAFPDKQGGSATAHCDSPASPVEDVYVPSTARGSHQTGIGESTSRTVLNEKSETVLTEKIHITPAEFVRCEPGQCAVLVDGQGEEMGKGKVHQVQGKWYGRILEESKVCVVDVLELKVQRRMRLPHPCEATGTTFDEAVTKLGLMRVLWDSNKLFMLQPR